MAVQNKLFTSSFFFLLLVVPCAGLAASDVLSPEVVKAVNEVTVKDAIVKLLRERRRAMHYKDIAATLVKEGRYKTKSRNFLSTVAITIMRDKRLEKVKPGVYRLKK